MHSPAKVQTLCFTNSQSGWLGAHGEIYRTTDAGYVWALVSSALTCTAGSADRWRMSNAPARMPAGPSWLDQELR